jgi:hypothetical protein
MPKIKKIMTAAVAAITLAGGLAAASDASAQRRHYDRRDHTGTAIAAGIAGLALGAALSGGGNRYYGSNYGYYGPGYSYSYSYAQPYYGRPYYGGSYYDRRYYDRDRRGYYGRPYARACTYWQYDRWGRAYQVRGRC